MNKVKFSDWARIADTYRGDPVQVKFVVKDKDEEETVTIEVKPHISLTDQIILERRVVDACCVLPEDYKYTDNTPEHIIESHKEIKMEYLEPVFRAEVLRYYTNLDLSAKKADLVAIWELAGNDDVYIQISDAIKDDLYEMHYHIENTLKSKRCAREVLAQRVLDVLNRISDLMPDRITQEFYDILKQADRLNINHDSLMSVLGGVGSIES